MVFTIYLIGRNFDLYKGIYEAHNSSYSKVLPHINNEVRNSSEKVLHFNELHWYKFNDSEGAEKLKKPLRTMLTLLQGGQVEPYRIYTGINDTGVDESLDSKLLFFDGGGEFDSRPLYGPEYHVDFDKGNQIKYNFWGSTGAKLEEEIEIDGTIYLKGKPSSLEHIKRKNAFLAVTNGRLYFDDNEGNNRPIKSSFFAVNPRCFERYGFTKK